LGYGLFWKLLKNFCRPSDTGTCHRAGRPTPSVANDSRLHPVAAWRAARPRAVGNRPRPTRAACPRAPGRSARSRASTRARGHVAMRFVGNVGNRKQIAHIAHKHAGVGICGQCGQLKRCPQKSLSVYSYSLQLYILYAYTVIFHFLINIEKHYPHYPQAPFRPMFSGV